MKDTQKFEGMACADMEGMSVMSKCETEKDEKFGNERENTQRNGNVMEEVGNVREETRNEWTVWGMVEENVWRKVRLYKGYDAETGERAPGSRVPVRIKRWYDNKEVLWLPKSMVNAKDPILSKLLVLGDIHRLKMWKRVVVAHLERLRIKHDFAYWAGRYVYIKPKGGGEEIPLHLNHPQRKFVEMLEGMREAGQPIRVVLLKARQWGGSTVSQMYMAWLQLVHEKGLNSLIIGHQGCASEEIRDMFDRMLNRYPVGLLYGPKENYKEDEPKQKMVGRSGLSFRVLQRNCKVKIGTAERPNSCRGGDYNLVHLSEVGMWRQTDGKKPEDIVRSACAGVVYHPMTMIVYESTANGVGNFFHREYLDARDNARSQFKALFIPWYEIEQNVLDFGKEAQWATAEDFAGWLLEHRHNETEKSNREESGRYLWRLWLSGATLEGIHWYITERSKHTSHGSMAAECPTDDTEAFVNSGASVFDKYRVEALREGCCKPPYVGELAGRGHKHEDALEGLHFVEDSQGALWVWEKPESQCGTQIEQPYLAVVDIGGRSAKSDWSVIVVFDRRPMVDGGKPKVVAQWYGHIDMDLLAWKAAQIAKWYDEALLVIESNTLETRDREREVDGDQSYFILNEIRGCYRNLYARRRSPEDVRMGRPVKYGFHTNVATKPMVISTLISAVREGLYVERDERCLAEMLSYERKPSGAYGAVLGAHDDLVMTRAIGLHICFQI